MAAPKPRAKERGVGERMTDNDFINRVSEHVGAWRERPLSGDHRGHPRPPRVLAGTRPVPHAARFASGRSGPASRRAADR
jgi:hypothetical protein